MNDKNSYEKVKEFHGKFSPAVTSEGPSISEKDISDERLRLYVNLIVEEVFELVGAAYSKKAQEYMENCWSNVYDDHIDVNSEGVYDRDIIEVADALADIEYVVNGFAHFANINLPEVISEVHDSNMSKLGEDGNPIYREDGKIMKGPNYFKPDIAKVLKINKDSEK